MGMVDVKSPGAGGRRVLRKVDITYNGASGMVITLPDGLTFGDIDTLCAISRHSESQYITGAAKYSDTQIITHYSSEYYPSQLVTVAPSATSFNVSRSGGQCTLQEILILIKE